MAIKLINKSLLDSTSAKAKLNTRLRMNHNFHVHLDDPVNRMLNAMEPGTYIRPHRHLNPPKVEAYVVLRGEVEAVIYDNQGNITLKETLNPLLGNYGIDIPAGTWHSMIVKASGTVIYEVKQGPFERPCPEDFAAWLPEPDDEEGIAQFLKKF